MAASSPLKTNQVYEFINAIENSKQSINKFKQMKKLLCQLAKNSNNINNGK